MRALRLAAALWAIGIVRTGGVLSAAHAQTPWNTAPTVSKPFIGTLDPANRAALVFVGPGEGVFGARIAIEHAGARVAGAQLADAVLSLGPHAADGSYGEKTWRFPGGNEAELSPPPDIRFRWGMQGGSAAAAVLDTSAPCDVVLEPYYPLGITAHYDVSPTLRGIVAWSGTVAGKERTCHFRLEADRPSRTPTVEQVKAGKGTTLRFRLAGGERLAVKGQVGAKAIGDVMVDRAAIEDALDEALGKLEEQGARRSAEGAAVGDALSEMLAYLPGHGVTYFASPPGPGHAVANTSGPDAWLSALAIAPHSKARACDIVYSLCETQLVTGCIPGFVDDYGNASEWSQPPLGSYCVLKLYERFGDPALLEYAYPRLLRWYRWWTEDTGTGAARHDGNGDGLLEWGGTSLEHAKLESAMPESPLWDQAGFSETSRTMTLNAVDLNSFRALDARCLGRMAEILEKPDDAATLSRDRELMRDRANAVLWDEEAGAYFGRDWDGRQQKRKTVASFYPLLAGIPTQMRAERMVRRALGDPDSWVGSPLGSYMVYEGLRHYGYNAEAAQLARRSAELVAGAGGPGPGWHASYAATTGEGIGAGWQRAGAVLSLIAGG